MQRRLCIIVILVSAQLPVYLACYPLGFLKRLNLLIKTILGAQYYYEFYIFKVGIFACLLYFFLIHVKFVNHVMVIYVWVSAEVSAFLHACEGDAVTRLTNEKIPFFNAPIYLQNKTQIGKVDEIFGPINESVSSLVLFAMPIACTLCFLC